MSLFLAILLIILAFAGGVFAGMYILRKQVEKEFAENPRLNVEAVRTLLGASGQRPSEAKVQQVYRQIINLMARKMTLRSLVKEFVRPMKLF